MIWLPETVRQNKFICCLLSLFICSSATAQVSQFNLRVAPLSLIDFYNGATYKGGVEWNIVGKNAITIEGGGYLNNFNGLTNIDGYLIDIGVRHYLTSNNMQQSPYLAVNYFYKNQTFDYRDSIVIPIPYELNYTTSKQVHCINLNAGKVIVLKHHLLLDIYGGLGIRLKDVQSTLTEFELENAIEYNDSQSLYFLVTPGNFAYPNVNLGLRIGWIFI